MSVPEDFSALIKTLQEMDVKPEAKSPEEFKAWMKQFMATEQVKQEPAGATATVQTTYHQPPRISPFSGKEGKGETSYVLWRWEVECLLTEKTHSLEVIAQAIRRSLRGEAGKVAMRLGPHAKMGDVLEKMDSVYGVVEEKESLMGEFYNATQREDEVVSTWSCRLEDTVQPRRILISPRIPVYEIKASPVYSRQPPPSIRQSNYTV